jgi:hypothetical protein
MTICTIVKYSTAMNAILHALYHSYFLAPSAHTKLPKWWARVIFDERAFNPAPATPSTLPATHQ